MTLSALDTWAFWLTITAIALPVLGGVAALLALLASSQAATIRDGELERFQAESMTKIAEANERAASANENAARLNIDVADSKARQSDAESRLRSVEGATAKQQERAANAEKDLLEVKARLEPRGIHSERFLTVLRKFPPATAVVEFVPGSPETVLFAGNLADHLRKAGWQVATPSPIPPEASGAGNVLAEIWFVARRLESHATTRQALSDALNAAGFTKLGGPRDEGLPDDRLRIRIGPRL